jgi:hypothetical protein
MNFFRILKNSIILIAVLLSCKAFFLSSIANGQEIDVQGAARAYVIFEKIYQICPKHVTFNAELVGKFKNMFRASGVKMFGEKAFAVARAAAEAEIRKDLGSRGAKIWCEYQKTRYQGAGFTELF